MATDLVAALLYSGQYSDFTIECQGHSFKVHKAIVCSQSPVIDAALHGKFKEAASNIVKISGFEVDTVQRMLSFMYGAEYTPLESNKRPRKNPRRAGARTASHPQPTVAENTIGLPGETKPPSNDISPGSREQQKKDLASHVWTNAIADYYQVQKLCDEVNDMIVASLQADWYPDTFLEVASLASSATGDKELHRLLTQLAADHVEELAQYDGDRLAGLVALDDFAVRITKFSAVRVAELTGLVNTHLAENETLTTNHKQLKKNETIYQSKIQKLTTDNTWYKTECSRLKRENDRLKPENEKLKAEIELCKTENKGAYSYHRCVHK